MIKCINAFFNLKCNNSIILLHSLKVFNKDETSNELSFFKKIF